MLVLTRKDGEEIVIGGSGDVVLRLRVIRCGNGKVRLGIEAPESVPVLRGELWESIGTRRPRTGAAKEGSGQRQGAAT